MRTSENTRPFRQIILTSIVAGVTVFVSCTQVSMHRPLMQQLLVSGQHTTASTAGGAEQNASLIPMRMHEGGHLNIFSMLMMWE